MTAEPHRDRRVGHSHVLGLVLAAGEGKRYGLPKALVDGWLADRVEALRAGGCTSVVAALGAAADQALPLVPAAADVVVVDDWREGMGASLRSGLGVARRMSVDAVLVALVDTPGLTAAVVERLIGAGELADPRHALVQATYGGRRGHPVLLGRAHWQGVVQNARGDRGARDYLAGRVVAEVECGDVGDGRDVDVKEPGS